MKVNKIGNAYFNEFDGMAQSCWNECAEYRGKSSAINTLIRNAGFKGDGTDKEIEILQKALQFGIGRYVSFNLYTSCIGWSYGNIG